MTPRPSLPPDFDAWTADHPDLSPNDLAAPWHLATGADPLDAAPAPDPAHIAGIRATLEEVAASAARAAAPRPALRLVPSMRVVLGMAAAVALLLAAGLYVWQKPITVSAPEGALAELTLPDGSQVHLNSGARLSYPRRFDAATRRVTLHGEAFFDVTQTGASFVIETFNARVAVLGTSFNVRAWPDDAAAETVVSVLTGTVEVTARETRGDAIRLAAGEAAHVGGTTPEPLPATDPVAATAWRDGRFVFFNQPLGVMFDEIERRYGVDIVAAEPIRQHVHNIRIRAENAEQLLNALCQSVDPMTMTLRYRATSDGFEVFAQ